MQLKRRVKSLTSLVLLVSAVKSEIEFNRKPVIKILKEAEHKKFLKRLSFVSQCVSLLEEGEDFKSAWEKALLEKSEASALTKEDIYLVSSFGLQLGTTDVNGQVNLCNLYLSLLGEKLREAEEYEKKYGKLYTQAGLFLGAAAGILFI